MDLLSIAARLFLDKSDYERGLSGAEQAAQGFSASLAFALNAAEAASGAAMAGIGRSVDGGGGMIAASAAGVAGRIASSFSALPADAVVWGQDMIQGFISGIASMWSGLRSAVSGVARMVRSFLGFSEPEEGPLSNFHTYAPDMMALFARGIRDGGSAVTDAVGDAFALRPAIAQTVAASGPEIAVPAGAADYSAPARQEAVMECDRTAFARLIYRLYNEEASRVGVRLSGGAAQCSA